MAPSGPPASSGSQHQAKEGGSCLHACLYPDCEFHFNASVNCHVDMQPIEYLFLTNLKRLNELSETKVVKMEEGSNPD